MRGTQNGVPQERNEIMAAAYVYAPQSVEALYDQYGGLAFALAYRILGERGIAEDVVQEAFLTVWRQQAMYDASRGSARTWIMTIVHHRAIDQLRGARAKYRADTAIKDAMPLPAKEDTWTTVAQQLEREWVRGALATLPPEQRQVVEMAYYGGLTHAEIAERVGIPLGTVKGRLRLALEKLRDILRVAETVGNEMEFVA